MFARHASALRGSCSSERTRPPNWRTPAASQSVEYPREPPIEHLAVGLRRDEREEETAGRRLDLPRAELPRDALLPLGCILALEAFHDGENPVVQHALDLILAR